MNKPEFKYKKPETNTSELRTPVEFYNSKVLEGLDGRDVTFEKVFKGYRNFDRKIDDCKDDLKNKRSFNKLST